MHFLVLIQNVSFFSRYSPIKDYDPVENQRKMERFAIDNNGLVAAYAETQFTFEEFREMCGPMFEGYDKLRKLHNSEKAPFHD